MEENRTNSPDISEIFCEHHYLIGIGEGKYACVNCPAVLTEYQIMGYPEDPEDVAVLSEN